jgi:hypothetical protein
VALWRTSAAPCASGRCKTGVANVESTSTGTSPACTTTASMSTRARVGLAGVSVMTSEVSGRRASEMVSGVAHVTSSPSIPHASRWSVVP